jgi:hypothetical protein
MAEDVCRASEPTCRVIATPRRLARKRETSQICIETRRGELELDAA